MFLKHYHWKGNSCVYVLPQVSRLLAEVVGGYDGIKSELLQKVVTTFWILPLCIEHVIAPEQMKHHITFNQFSVMPASGTSGFSTRLSLGLKLVLAALTSFSTCLGRICFCWTQCELGDSELQVKYHWCVKNKNI